MTDNRQKILRVLEDDQGLSPSEIILATKLSRALVHKHLKELLNLHLIKKTGRAPHTRYTTDPVQRMFLYRSVDGRLLWGMDGFVEWAKRRYPDTPMQELVERYEKSVRRYQDGKKDDLFFIMDADKLPADDIVIDALYCFHLWTLPFEGNDGPITREAALLGVIKGSGKESTLRSLSENVVVGAVDDIRTLLAKKGIPCVAFVPPTAERSVQIMRMLERSFDNLDKGKTGRLSIDRDFSESDYLRQEQKHIRDVAMRSRNARQTYRIRRVDRTYPSVLVVDDLMGSGATLNEIARKIKDAGIADKVYGACIVGINTKKLVVERKV